MHIFSRTFALLVAAALALTAEAARPHLRADSVKIDPPLDIDLLLSGNFGELRRNHFHSGVDFKTQGRTGLPVYAVDSGYVSRVSVSPWGFGRAVYVTHPHLGLTTVYGHLEAFAPQIAAPVCQRQYEAETFAIDINFKPGEIPVKRHQMIARSGNSGSSGGPHLHFDVRDTETEDPLDPLEYLRGRIVDRTPPEVRLLALYPADAATIDGSPDTPAYRQPQSAKQFTAWGAVVPGIKAYDRMNGTTNIYGVKYLSLLLDGDTIYSRVIDRFSFDNTKAVNTLVDFRDLNTSGSWVMTTAVPDARPLGNMVKAKNKGVVNIKEEKTYRFTWVLEDEHGNVTRQPFIVEGRRQVPPSRKASGQLALWDADNLVEHDGAYIEIPDGALYQNQFIDVEAKPSSVYHTALYTIGSPHIPLAQPIDITLPIAADTVTDKTKYCLVRLDPGNKRTAVKARYADGCVNAKPDRFGTYALTTDTVAPKIVPLNPANWKARKTVSFKITDNLSGIESWRGEIDGRWALFELDGKTATLSFRMDPERFPGSRHTISLTVTDACGNTARHTQTWTN